MLPSGEAGKGVGQPADGVIQSLVHGVPPFFLAREHTPPMHESFWLSCASRASAPPAACGAKLTASNRCRNGHEAAQVRCCRSTSTPRSDAGRSTALVATGRAHRIGLKRLRERIAWHVAAHTRRQQGASVRPSRPNRNRPAPSPAFSDSSVSSHALARPIASYHRIDSNFALELKNFLT